MWSDIFVGYGVFILEVITLLLVVAAVVAMIIDMKQKKAHLHGELAITDLSKEFEENSKILSNFHLSEDELKEAEKAEKKAEKAKEKALKAQRKKVRYITLACFAIFFAISISRPLYVLLSGLR